MTCISRTSCAAGLTALTLIAIAPSGALAADMPSWPSPAFKSSGPIRWDGINFGAQLGLSNMNSDFGNSTSDLVAYILRNTELEDQFSPSTWTALPANTTNGRQFGAFLGYNWQWDQLVIGFDAAYNYMSSMQTSASDTISRQVVTTPDNVNNAVTITAQSSLKLIDYATGRMRAGYTFGQFLPYAMVGGAVGRFDYANTATVHNVGTPPAGSPVLPFDTIDTDSSAKNNAVVGGVLAGLGVDVSVFANVFLRAEWEYVAFAPVGGIRANMNTGRVAIGARF